MSQSSVSFTTRSAQPRSGEERRHPGRPGFGLHFTDHGGSAVGQGHRLAHAGVQPYGPLQLDPAAAVLHYAQEIFEGLKAYRHADGSIWAFRPEARTAPACNGSAQAPRAAGAADRDTSSSRSSS